MTKDKDRLCRHCREPLSQIPWNAKSDLLLCDNMSCPLYRQPQGNVHLATGDEKKFTERLEQMARNGDWAADQPVLSIDEGDGDG